jgi:hypothetical protein
MLYEHDAIGGNMAYGNSYWLADVVSGMQCKLSNCYDLNRLAT